MAPTPSPILIHSPNPPSTRHFHHLRRQSLPFSHHPPGQPSASHVERIKPRILDVALQPSVALKGQPPPPIGSTPTGPLVLTPEPSAIPVKDGEPRESSLPGDVPGNIVAGVILIVLVLGGLVGLVIGGEILRRRARTRGKRVPPPSSRCCGSRKSKPTRNATGSLRQSTKTSHKEFPYDEKTLSPLTRPPPALNRERQRRFSDVWPIRSLSQALCSRRWRSEQIEHDAGLSPQVATPQTTWSDFSLASPYVVTPRTVLSRIPEELEDCESQTDIALILGVALQRPPEPDSAASAVRSPYGLFLEGFSGSESLVTTKQRDSQDRQTTLKVGTRDEDTKSLGSSAPDMTSDGGESSRSSMTSLESLEGGNDRESIREEAFELRRAQTRSMQMNKGVLLSLSLKTLDDGQDLESADEELECGPSRSLSASDAGGKDFVEREMNLATLGGSFSAVSLDEFPSPPSMLPMIPSLVSSF